MEGKRKKIPKRELTHLTTMDKNEILGVYKYDERKQDHRFDIFLECSLNLTKKQELCALL